jgi:hypothetical protein
MFNMKTEINRASRYINYGVAHPRYICDRDDDEPVHGGKRRRRKI